jgi:hypothetical protein
LTYADGQRHFYDRTTWWDATPLGSALLAGLLALFFSHSDQQRHCEVKTATLTQKHRTRTCLGR